MATAALRKHPLAWALLALVLVALLVLGWRVLRPPQVDALRVQAVPLVRTLQVSARVATDARVEVGATVTGRVERVLVQEGEAVRAGQPLVQLEQDELQAALAQAEAALVQAQARVAGLRGTGRDALAAAVAQADAQLRSARAELARNEQLVAQGFVSAARLDESRRAVDVAAAQRAAAVAQSRATGDGGTDLAQAQAQVTVARAAVDAARARLAQTSLVAPADARVLARQVEPGQIVQPGRALLRLALDGPRQLVAQVDERFLEQLRIGHPASAVADAYPGQRFSARVASLAPAVDPQRGAIEVKFALGPQPPDFLREDLTVSVEVETGRREQALVLPLAALRGPDTVWVVQAGRVEERRLRMGLRTLEAVEVLGGLSPGDLVLLDEARVGARVRPRELPWQPRGEPSAAAPGTGGSDPLGSLAGGAVGR
ncbi:efflux RND transporter periplasmic adaptor subunit [Ramlibacter sp. AN1015]|uniref:efflux RND transporter periplasmic adaptor subunit n=1 Tax=Ramlibacter sp. AN1015 TaxID=3133428 RepID=UPI0030C5496B